MDRILIRDLLVRCRLGVDEEERRERQDVVVNAALGVDLAAAARSDRFEDAVDYRAVKKSLVAAAESSELRLLEALAEHLAAVCLAHRGVKSVRLTVDKPGALRFARSVAVEIERPARAD